MRIIYDLDPDSEANYKIANFLADMMRQIPDLHVHVVGVALGSKTRHCYDAFKDLRSTWSKFGESWKDESYDHKGTGQFHWDVIVQTGVRT